MNLITDAWIPIRRKSGKMESISPCQITDGSSEDKIVGLAAPRPDFNGALIQFLIGLLQTTCAPQNQHHWRQWWQQPPAFNELEAAFKPIAFAFELDGDGPRFMQDLTLESEVKALPAKKQEERINGIYELLIDAPTGKTLSDNTDHFIKRGRINQLCLPCAAMSLFTLQTNAPSGGQGHRTGLRGGGPLTTLVLADTVWSTCWLNILECQTFLSLARADGKKDRDRFPWLAPTRTSEGGKETTLEDVHPDQIFWSMPRRLRLVISNERQDGACDLCGIQSERMVRHFLVKNLGINYKGPWIHPLSPHFIDNTGAPSAIHPQPGGIGYRHWLGLVQSQEDKKGKRRPALVIENFVQHRRNDLRLWAFGYNMDNMKACCWYDSTMPIILSEENIQKTYESYIAAMVNCAQQVSLEIRTNIKKALFRPGLEVKGDLSFLTSRFWLETESYFFTSLYLLRNLLTKNADAIPVLESWHKHLAQVAEVIFHDISQSGAFEAVDPKRVALAWLDLQRNIHSKKLREQLGLPVRAYAKRNHSVPPLYK